jgi:hypothetical protein
MGRIAGWLLMAIGIIHVVLFLWVGRGALLAVVQEGFFKALYPHHDRLAIFWSLCFGMMLFFLGQLISWREAQGKRIPAFLGWEIFGLTALGAVLMPVSGWWLAMVSAVLILVGSRRARLA